MPANLPPQYHTAYEKYRKAPTIEEKLKALKEMWAVMPKHKGTDKLQAEIKRRMSQLKKEMSIQKQIKGKRTFSPIPEKEGAGQVILIGAPNTGKSSLLKSLTNAEPDIADYPFSTQMPLVGMLLYEDIQFQLVDTPPITPDHFIWWQREIIRYGNLVLLITDLSQDDFIESLENILRKLRDEGIFLVRSESKEMEEFGGPAEKRTLIVANKFDLKKTEENFDLLKEFVEERYLILKVSAKMGEGLNTLKNEIFRTLDVVRVYTKEPGKPPVMKDPLVLPRGATLLDAALNIHKDFSHSLKYARLWGSSRFDGQRVERNYILEDRDIVEFHT